jgi:hypothetical protein
MVFDVLCLYYAGTNSSNLVLTFIRYHWRLFIYVFFLILITTPSIL